jgi:small subunit ribosomal protein S21e
VSFHMNVAEVVRVTGWFNGHFKTYGTCGFTRRMSKPDNSILQLAKADGIVSKNF